MSGSLDGRGSVNESGTVPVGVDPTPPGALSLRDISLADVLALVGLGLLLIAWQEFGNGLLFAGEGHEGEADYALRGVFEAVPAIVLTAAGFLLLRGAPRADRFGAVLLVVGGMRWPEIGGLLGRSMAADGTGPGIAAGAALWIAIAATARRRSWSIYTDLGLAAAIAVGAFRVGEPVIAGAFGIDLNDFEAQTRPGPALAMALAAWYLAVAGVAFAVARRLVRPVAGDIGPRPWVRVLVFDTTAAGIAALGVQAAMTGWIAGERAVVAPTSAVVMLVLSVALASVGLAVRSAPYFVGAVWAFAVAVGEAAQGSTSLLEWPGLLAIGATIGGLAIGAAMLERWAARRSMIPERPATAVAAAPTLRLPTTAEQLQDLVRLSLVDALAATSAGFLLASWHRWAADLTGRWVDVLEYAPPAAAAGAVAIVLLRRPGAVGRIASVLALVAGVEIAFAGGASFTALTRNEGGVGGLVGAIYWLLLAAVVRYRHGSTATQVGIVASLLWLGVQGDLTLPVLAFGTPTYSESGPVGAQPGPILSVMVAAWWAAIGLSLALLAARERRRVAGSLTRAAMATVTEIAAALVLPIGLANAVLNYHAGWERGFEPPTSSILVGLVAVGLVLLRSRTGSGYYLAGAGVALLLAVGDVNTWLSDRGVISGEVLAAAEGAILLAIAAVAARRRHRNSALEAAEATDPAT